MLGCILGEDWTTPRLLEMQITPDGHLLGRSEGQVTFYTFLGASEDLLRNVHWVAKVAELDGDEVGFLLAKIAEIKRQKCIELLLLNRTSRTAWACESLRGDFGHRW